MVGMTAAFLNAHSPGHTCHLCIFPNTFTHWYYIRWKLGSSQVPQMLGCGYVCTDDCHLRSSHYCHATNLLGLLNRIGFTA